MSLRRLASSPVLVLLFSLIATAGARAEEKEATIADKVDGVLRPFADFLVSIIFWNVPIFGGIPLVLIILAGTALFLSIYFRFISLRSFKLAWRTIRGKYSSKDDPGQITHFQALSTALSATVGLGNIAGVAVAIGIGGPGAVFWMIVMGFLGMTSKFTECTLGVRYRQIDEHGRVHGGGMFYLRDGLKERGLGPLGKVLAVIFAVACIGGALGAGCMFQVNQAQAQMADTFNIFAGDNESWKFGAIVAVLVGLVIIGGIVWIARVTEVLVPFMCVIYIIACLVVLAQHAGEVPAALVTIVREAFSMEAGFGGFIGGLIQGIRRGVFSNEAGVGSAAIAHSAVKTRKPASEGVVALLEPFVDTVVVCTMTALVIVVTGMWKVNSDVKVERLIILDQPVAGAEAAATYEKGVMLKVKGKWQQATVRKSGEMGWLPAGSVEEDKEAEGVFVAPGEVILLEKPGGKVEVTTVPEGSEVTLDEMVWAQVHHPDEDKTGWVSFADLNDRANFAGGIWLTSQAFAGVISWFPKVLTLAVFLFAFSTMISWSYYGQQALGYLVKERGIVVIIYKVVFCGCVILGSAASLGSVIDISDSLFFAMVVPNMIGLYVLLPVVKEELQKFREHVAEIDAKDS